MAGSRVSYDFGNKRIIRAIFRSCRSSQRQFQRVEACLKHNRIPEVRFDRVAGPVRRRTCKFTGDVVAVIVAGVHEICSQTNAVVERDGV